MHVYVCVYACVYAFVYVCVCVCVCVCAGVRVICISGDASSMIML